MARSRRYAAVVAATALLCAVPALVGWLPARAAPVAPATLLARVRASAPVAYSGLAESRGALGLPSVPRLRDVAALLSGTTRTRVWYAGPHRLRVDRITPIGEDDAVRDPAGEWQWSSAQRAATRIEGAPTLRLPEPLDLLPAELGRRLAAPGRDARVLPLLDRRVAGHPAAGVRVVPPPTTTVGHVDIWADPDTGLALRVDVVARGADVPAVTTRFLDVRLGAPPAGRTAFAPPADATVAERPAPDVLADIDRYSPYQLPPQVAGLPQRPRVRGVGGGAATYGDGYTLLTVVPLPADLADSLTTRLLGAARPPRIAGVDTAPVTSPLVNALVVASDPGYLLAGTVPAATLRRAAAELLAGSA